MEAHIRPATGEDLLTATRVGLAARDRDPATIETVPSVLPHLLRTSSLLIAERDGEIVGFGSAFTRGSVTFLAQLFILPNLQSAGLGRRLLQKLMPDDGLIRATIPTDDPRAVSLYVRHGMRPLWPMYDLLIDVPDMRAGDRTTVDVVLAAHGDPGIIRADAEIGGRERPEEIRYWEQEHGGVPLWFERAGRRIGYGYLQVLSRSSDAALYGHMVRVGPLGTYDPADSLACLLAAVEMAREHGEKLIILVPGPHPALRPLLEMGFRIGDQEAFLSSSDPPFVDSRRYIPSGGGLF